MKAPLSLIVQAIAACTILLATGVVGNFALAGEFENVGKTGPVKFSENLLAGNLGYVFGVAAADLDGDGDLDLTSPRHSKQEPLDTILVPQRWKR